MTAERIRELARQAGVPFVPYGDGSDEHVIVTFARLIEAECLHQRAERCYNQEKSWI